MLFKAATNITAKKTKAESAKQTAACVSYFNMLSPEEQQVILDEMKRQPFLAYLPDKNTRIFAYMTNTKRWQPTE